jgi:hypothetical protein
MLPQTEIGKASGKHHLIFQLEPHKCPLMRRRLSPRIYPARSIRLTSEPVRVATPCPCAMNSRRFPPPWSVDELEACFVVIRRARLPVYRFDRLR